LLGDITTGCIIGASLEAIYLGAVNIGGATSAEPVSATAMSTCFAIHSGLTIDEAITMAVPIGLIFNSIGMLVWFAGNLFTPWYLNIVKKGAAKEMTTFMLVTWFLSYFTRALIIFACVWAGSAAVETFMSNLPENVLHAFSVSSGLIGAVGMAILMRMLANKETTAWLLVGFVLAKYLGLPAIVIAIIGVAIAITVGFSDKRMIDLDQKMKNAQVQPVDEEEAFFK
jgi:PTS system mannose-specific IIC component